MAKHVLASRRQCPQARRGSIEAAPRARDIAPLRVGLARAYIAARPPAQAAVEVFSLAGLADTIGESIVKLLYTPGSPFARIIRVLLRELALDCREVEIEGFPPSDAHFAVNPLGQVPALETPEGVKFPTRIIIDYLMAQPRGRSLPLAPAVRREENRWQDDQMLAVLLAMGDALAALKYQDWAGLRRTGSDLLGFDPAERHAERACRTLDWLEARATPDGLLPGVLSVQDIALACFALWTDARGGFPWRGRPRLEAIVAACAARPSFAQTPPQPWP